MSFDYFAPFDFIKVGFTDLWSWSPNFEWLGYDTVQFLLGLGSITVFAAGQILTSVIALAIITCRLKLPFKWARRYFSAENTWANSLIFLHGTYFEIAVCVCISMSLVNFWDYLNSADKMSAYFAFMFLFFIVFYLIFAFYFAFCLSGNFALKHRAEIEK